MAGCNEKEDPATPPLVKLHKGPVSALSTTFTVEPQHADACAYTFIQEGIAEPSSEEIMQTGQPLSADEPATTTVTGLEPETSHVILAAARSGETLSPVARLK